MDNKEILKFARENYKEGTVFLSTTNKLKSNCIVLGKIKWSENYPNCLVSECFGIIYDGDTKNWAEIISVKSN